MSSNIYSDGTYKAHNPTWGEEDSQWKSTQILSVLRAHSIQPKTVGEIGCGAGGVLAGVVDGLPSVTLAEGWDPSPLAISMARPKGSERLHYLEGNLLAAENHYDLILCIDVFEHVPDYLGFLCSLRERAKHIVFHIPLDMHCSAILRNLHKDVREAVGHLHYFTRPTALATLVDCGYRVLEERYTRGALARLGGHRGLKTDLANVVRKLFADDLSAKLFGGYSLLVLVSCDGDRG